MNKHECRNDFTVTQYDNMCGNAYDLCSGIDPMLLELWFSDKDYCGEYYDNWSRREVKFCPFCGLKAN